MDSRSSAGPKRAKKGENDWVCAKCGNSNYSFRKACNRTTCGAPKPEDVPQAHGGRYHGSSHVPPIPSAYGSSMPTAAPYNYGAPSAYNLPGSNIGMGYGSTAYGSSTGYGSSSGYGSSVGYGGGAGYGSSGSGYLSPGFGSLGYGGSGYRSLMDGYGLGIGMSPPPQMAAGRPGFYQEEEISARKRRGGPDNTLSDGDWICPKCGNTNFSFRTSCNLRKCGALKPAPKQNVPSKKSSDEAPPAGSWTCEKCSNVNYPFREKCNRKNCGANRPGGMKESSPHDSE